MPQHQHAQPPIYHLVTGQPEEGARPIDTADKDRWLVPDASTVILVLAGFETPDTALLVVVHDMLEWWQQHHARLTPGTRDAEAADLIEFGAFLIDREVEFLFGVRPAAEPVGGVRTYGQVVASLVQGFVGFESSRGTRFADVDRARLTADIEALDTLANNLRAAQSHRPPPHA
ncbi:MAG: hypothetical protein J2P17_15410 [Mycobacterium sp.]|nr:hypothetical protein [Mycobacterium sp.]